MKAALVAGVLAACARPAPPPPATVENIPPAVAADARPSPSSAAFDEVSGILATGRWTIDPEKLRRIEQRSGPIDLTWDPHRVWLLEYRQSGQTLEISIGAVDASDAVAFAKRLNASALLEDVTVASGERQNDAPPWYLVTIEASAPREDPRAPPITMRP